MSKISIHKSSKLFSNDEEDSDSSCYLLIADYDKREVSTNCGDLLGDTNVTNKEEERASLIEITDDKEFMERVLKKSEEMQEEVLKKAEEEEG